MNRTHVSTMVFVRNSRMEGLSALVRKAISVINVKVDYFTIAEQITIAFA